MKNLGLGLELAEALRPPHVQQPFVLPEELPNIGAVPVPFNGVIATYQHLDILMLIIFYNDSFGILQPDNLGIRIDKFRAFLISV